jgi:hypothetical protein
MSARRVHQARDLFLPVTLLSRYLYFVGRRPVSASNSPYLARRIRAFQTLAPFFQASNDPALHRVGDELRALTVANLPRLSGVLHAGLKGRTAETLPSETVVSAEAPPASFWSGCRRALLILGPGIGIGDEIICFRIPAALQSLAGGSSVSCSVLSAYDSLWDRVGTVAGAATYHGLDELVHAIRGAATDDLLVFIDFEPSGLLPSICYEAGCYGGGAPRFVELSLGTRSLAILDAANQRVHRMPLVDPYYANYYACLQHMLQWLGAPSLNFADAILPVKKAEPGREFTVLVSPFTSKEDPSQIYWSRLISHMIPPDLPGPVRIHIDTGATPASASFARALAQSSANWEHPDCRCLVAGSASGGGPTPLREMLDWICRADAVVTADSFPAHASAAFGAPTFVIAREGFENWRAPSWNSLYLPAEASPLRLARAIGSVLRSRLLSRPALTDRSFEFISSNAQTVAETLERPGSEWDKIASAWEEFSAALRPMAARIEEWPDELAALSEDRSYNRMCDSFPARDCPGGRAWLSNELFFWTNSNAHKLSRMQPASARRFA